VAFRDLVKKKKPEAKPKYGGQPVHVPGPRLDAYCQQVTEEALTQVCRRIPQRTRDFYDGRVEMKDVLVPTVGKRITVLLVDKRCKTEITGNVIHDDVSMKHKTARAAGTKLADILCREIIEHERVCKERPKEDLYEREQRLIETKNKIKPKLPKDRKPKKVCKICGPEDPLYPEWEGVCIHE